MLIQPIRKIPRQNWLSLSHWCFVWTSLLKYKFEYYKLEQLKYGGCDICVCKKLTGKCGQTNPSLHTTLECMVCRCRVSPNSTTHVIVWPSKTYSQINSITLDQISQMVQQTATIIGIHCAPRRTQLKGLTSCFDGIINVGLVALLKYLLRCVLKANLDFSDSFSCSRIYCWERFSGFGVSELVVDEDLSDMREVVPVFNGLWNGRRSKSQWTDREASQHCTKWFLCKHEINKQAVKWSTESVYCEHGLHKHKR